MAQEVNAYCDRRRSEARQEAERILADGRRVADQEYARGIEATQAEIDRADRRERQRLNAETEKAALAVQHKVVEEVLGEARAELLRLAESDEFGPVLETLLDEILQATPGEGLVVLVPPAHADRIRGWLQSRGRSDLEVRPAPALKDGAAVQDARQTFRVSNTLTGRLKVVLDEARKHCHARLFAEEG